jgi:hypothetical protein
MHVDASGGGHDLVLVPDPVPDPVSDPGADLGANVLDPNLGPVLDPNLGPDLGANVLGPNLGPDLGANVLGPNRDANGGTILGAYRGSDSLPDAQPDAAWPPLCRGVAADR